MVFQRHKDDVGKIMASKTPDEGQKYRLTKRLAADLDLHIALHNFKVVDNKIENHSSNVANNKNENNTDPKMKSDLMRQRGAANRDFTKFRWRACKLYLFAPLEDVALSERWARLYGQIRHEIPAPTGRSLEAMIFGFLCMFF